MSKERCSVTGKVRFETKGDAQHSMLNIKNSVNFYRYDEHNNRRRIKRRQGKPQQVRVYECEHCQGYHLTSWVTSNKID